MHHLPAVENVDDNLAGSNQPLFSVPPDMFDGTTMVLVPPEEADAALIERVKHCFAPARFSRFIITTAEKHDAMIAFTSQLAHVVASSYIKSPTADEPEGFSAGSYRDLTRVAWLSPELQRSII